MLPASIFVVFAVAFASEGAVWWYSYRNGCVEFFSSVEKRVMLKDVLGDIGPKVPFKFFT